MTQRPLLLLLCLLILLVSACGGANQTRGGEGHSPASSSSHAGPNSKSMASSSSGRGEPISFVPQGGAHGGQILVSARAGELAATGGTDHRVVVWHYPSKTKLRVLNGHSGDIIALAFSPDTQLLASGSRDQSARIWDIRTGKLLRKIEMPKLPPELSVMMVPEVSALAFIDQGRTLVVGAGDGSLVTYDVATGAAKRAFDRPKDCWEARINHPIEYKPCPVRALSEEGGRLLVGELGGKPRAYDLATGAAVPTDKLLKEVSIEEHLARVPGLPLNLQENGVGNVAVSNDGALLASTSKDGARLWNLRTMAMEMRLPVASASGVAFSPNNARLFVLGSEGLEAWDVTQSPPKRVWRSRASGHLVEVSSEGTSVVVAGVASVSVYEAAGGNRQWASSVSAGLINSVAMSKGTLCVAGSMGASLVESTTGRVTKEWGPRDAPMIGFSPNCDVAVSNWKSSTTAGALTDFRIWNASTQTERGDFSGHEDVVVAAAFSPDGTTLATGDLNGVIGLWDLTASKTPTPTKVMWSGHARRITSLHLLKDRKTIVSSGDDGVVRIGGPTSFVSLIAKGDEWLAFTQDGYFDASKRGGELAAVVQGLRAFRVDQLAPRNNRPDILIERLGIPNAQDAIAHFRSRHERRLKALGLTEASLTSSFDAAPETKIESLTPTNALSSVSLKVLFDGRGASLREYNVWVNDVPVPELRAKSVNGNRAEVTLAVPLSGGRNKIEVSCIGAGGAESLRDVRVVEGPPDTKPTIHFVGLGVSRYKDARLNLQYAHKDVMDLADVFRSGGAQVQTFLDQEVTAAAMKRARDTLMKTAKTDDVVVVLVAGHGTHTRDALADYVFVAHDTNVKDLRRTAIPYERIEEILQDIPARRKLLLLDTCESGERDDAEESALTVDATAASRGLRARSTRALVLESASPKAGGSAKRTFLNLRERYIYNDLARRTGAIVLASSRGNEVSYEHDDIKNGVFTEEIMRALTGTAADTNSDGQISSEELRAYVMKAVAERTSDRQHPTLDRDNVEQHVAFPLFRNASAVVER